MKCNIRPRLRIPGVIDRELTAREAKIAQVVWEEANRQFKEEQLRLMDVALETHLAALHRRYGWGARVLRAIWEDTIRMRAEARTFFRDLGVDGAEYGLQRTGDNIEDTAIRRELLDIGVDVRAWEAAVVYDERTGDVNFTDEP